WSVIRAAVAVLRPVGRLDARRILHRGREVSDQEGRRNRAILLVGAAPAARAIRSPTLRRGPIQRADAWLRFVRRATEPHRRWYRRKAVCEPASIGLLARAIAPTTVTSSRPAAMSGCA